MYTVASPNPNECNSTLMSEGEEGVKWELRFALFLTEKLGLAFLGLGCMKVGMRNKILKMGLGYINCKKK